MATHDIRSVIQKNYENLLNINVGEILGDLIDGNIIDLDEAKEIGFGSDKETANNLVQRLRGKSSEQIRRFCSILQTSEVHFTQITGFKLGSYIAEEDNAYRYKLERQLTVEDCDAIHEVGYDDEQRLIPTEGNEEESSTLCILCILYYDREEIKRRILFRSRKLLRLLLDNPLHDFPKLRSDAYIKRGDLINTIAQNIRYIHDHSGHILVCGMAACGKTIAVYQAVQKIAKEGLFNRHGCHWIKIGLIRDQELLLILQNLCITLNIPLDGNCRTLDSVYAKLKKEFGEKEDLYKRLLVIDDVWNDHLRYLDFAPRSIVTMRIKPERFLDGYIYVKVPANLTEEEAMQVLMKHRPKTDQVALKNNNSVKKLLDHTKCLPLAVDLIGRHGLTGEEDWKKAIELIMGAKSRYTMEYNGENAYGTFNYSIQELKQTGQSYEHFISLGVFKRVKVPVSTIAIYWNLNEHDTIAILETFDSYTLLKYWNENGGYITIHDLIIDYLRQPDVASVDLLKLHQELIAKYFNKYDGNWSKCVGDKYMRDNLIYHVVKTKNKQYLREIINDFNYMSTRMNFDNELYGILYDLKFCCNRGPYQEQVNAKCDVLLRLLEQYRSCIDPAIMDMVQIFLILAEKDNWLYLRAFELAKSNIKTRKAKYWMILDMYSGKTEKANWIKRKSLGKIRNDSSICSSNPRFGPLEIINTKYNGTFECTVSITDSENGTQRWEVPLPFQYIAELKISADGNIVALCERMGENLVWTIYDSNKNLKLIFKAGTKSESQHQKFHSLAFSPDDAPSIMTLSQDRKLVQFWEASGIKIQLKSEVISIQNPIQSCKWIRNGNGAIFLWKLSVCTKCEDKNTRTTSEAIEKQELTAKERGKNQDKQQIEDKNNKEEIVKNEIGEENYYISIYDMNSHRLSEKFELPATLHFRNGDENFSSKSKNEEILPLNYVDHYEASKFLIIYGGKRSINFMGFINFKQINNPKAFNSIENFAKNFQCILKSEGHIEDVILTENRQYLAVNNWKYGHIMVFKLEFASGMNIQITKLKVPFGAKNLTSIPYSHRLLVFEYEYSHSLYEYDLHAHDLVWEPIANTHCARIDICNSQYKSVEFSYPQPSPHQQKNNVNYPSVNDVTSENKYHQHTKVQKKDEKPEKCLTNQGEIIDQCRNNDSTLNENLKGPRFDKRVNQNEERQSIPNQREIYNNHLPNDSTTVNRQTQSVQDQQIDVINHQYPNYLQEISGQRCDFQNSQGINCQHQSDEVVERQYTLYLQDQLKQNTRRQKLQNQLENINSDNQCQDNLTKNNDHNQHVRIQYEHVIADQQEVHTSRSNDEIGNDDENKSPIARNVQDQNENSRYCNPKINRPTSNYSTTFHHEFESDLKGCNLHNPEIRNQQTNFEPFISNPDDINSPEQFNYEIKMKTLDGSFITEHNNAVVTYYDDNKFKIRDCEKDETIIYDLGPKDQYRWFLQCNDLPFAILCNQESISFFALSNSNVQNSYPILKELNVQTEENNRLFSIDKFDLSYEIIDVISVSARFRSCDSTLIFIIIVLDKKCSQWIMIRTINLKKGERMNYTDTDDKYVDIRLIYMDDDNLITMQRCKRNLQLYCMKWYQFDALAVEPKLFKQCSNTKKLECELACKIKLADEKEKCSILLSRIQKNEDESHFKKWKKADAKMIISCRKHNSGLYFLVKKYAHTSVINGDQYVMMTGREEKQIEFIKGTKFFNFDNLWSEKCFVTFETKSMIIRIYDANTLKCNYSLPLPFFEIADLKWNQEKSSFFVSDRSEKYCVMKLYTKLNDQLES